MQKAYKSSAASFTRGAFLQQNDTAHTVNPVRAIRIHKLCQSLSQCWSAELSSSPLLWLMDLMQLSSIATSLSVRSGLANVIWQFYRIYEAHSSNKRSSLQCQAFIEHGKEFVKSCLIQPDPLQETIRLVSMGCYGSFLKTLSLIMGGWLLSLFSQVACADKKWEALCVSQIRQRKYAGSTMNIGR